MKRIMTFAIFMAVCAISAKAQLEVDSLGNVFVGTNITDGRLNVGKAGLKCSSDSLPAISVSTTSGIGHSTQKTIPCGHIIAMSMPYLPASVINTSATLFKVLSAVAT